MAISFVADGGWNGSGTSPVALTVPATAADGDLLLMFGTIITTGGVSGTLTTPAGWNFVVLTGGGDDGSGDITNVSLYYRIASSEPGSYNLAYNTGGTFASVEGNIRAYRGTGTVGSPINSTATVITAGSSTTNIVPALTETFVSGEWYVGASIYNQQAADSTAQSPTLSNVLLGRGFFANACIGNLIPVSAPGAETFTYTGTSWLGRVGVGVSILPPAVAGGSILLMPQACL